MEARAFVKSIPMSPRKMRVITNMVRGQDVGKALSSLDLMPKKAAGLIAKAVRSAVANADDRSGGEVDVDGLKIAQIFIDGGPVVKRWMPRAMGRANRINHRTSHLTVVVSDD